MFSLPLCLSLPLSLTQTHWLRSHTQTVLFGGLFHWLRGTHCASFVFIYHRLSPAPWKCDDKNKYNNPQNTYAPKKKEKKTDNGQTEKEERKKSMHADISFCSALLKWFCFLFLMLGSYLAQHGPLRIPYTHTPALAPLCYTSLWHLCNAVAVDVDAHASLHLCSCCFRHPPPLLTFASAYCCNFCNC